MKIAEKDFQQGVMDFAKLRGWRTYHPYRSTRSTPGFPDITLVRRGRLIFAELKAESGTLSAHQKEWLQDLRNVHGVEVFVWRPSDWPEIERVLR